MLYYVYILYSLKAKNLYIGRTVDIYKRLIKHNKGWVRSTRSRRPMKLVHCEVYREAREVYFREKELKYPSAGKFKKALQERLGLG